MKKTLERENEKKEQGKKSKNMKYEITNIRDNPF